MIAVVVVAILASIAVPSYRDYVTRSRIPDATSVLATKRVEMEQWFQDMRTYEGAPACTATSNSNFTFDCSVAASATGFTLRATGTGSMTGFEYTIDQNNAKSSTITGVSGWSGNADCWVVAKGGQC